MHYLFLVNMLVLYFVIANWNGRRTTDRFLLVIYYAIAGANALAAAYSFGFIIKV